MSDWTAAKTRLDAAFARVEAALKAKDEAVVAALDAATNSAKVEAQNKIDSLQSDLNEALLEKNRLTDSLKKAEGNHKRLEEASLEVERRLDTVIGKVKTALDTADTKQQSA